MTTEPHEHDWQDTAFSDVKQCVCGAMLARGQLFYQAWEFIGTSEGSVVLEHPAGEAVRKAIEDHPDDVG